MPTSGWYTVRDERFNRVNGGPSPANRCPASPLSTESETDEVSKLELGLKGTPRMPRFDVFTVVCVRIESPDVNQAENAVIDLLEYLTEDALDAPGVIETGISLGLQSPVSAEVEA